MWAEEPADSGVLVGTPKDDNETEAADGSEPPAMLDAMRRGGGAAAGEAASRRTRSLSTRSCRLFICFFRVISTCGAAEPVLGWDIIPYFSAFNVAKKNQNYLETMAYFLSSASELYQQLQFIHHACRIRDTIVKNFILT
jgi:hypothetical protein